MYVSITMPSSPTRSTGQWLRRATRRTRYVYICIYMYRIYIIDIYHILICNLCTYNHALLPYQERKSVVEARNEADSLC